jgi:Flp pilus assembly protein CpaB
MLRRSPRTLVLWGAALAVAVITAIVVGGDLATLHRRAGSLGPERDAVLATHDLAVGTTLDRGDLGTRRVHRSQLPPGVLATRSLAVARVVVVPVLRGEFVTQRNLAPRRRTGLDGILPAGMRAMRLVVTDALRPRTGAAVDVLASYDPGPAEASGNDTTFVVARGVLVLGTDDRAGTGTGRAGALGVTVLVEPEEARELADAQVNGVLTLALVPPEDARHP